MSNIDRLRQQSSTSKIDWRTEDKERANETETKYTLQNSFRCSADAIYKILSVNKIVASQLQGPP